MNNGYRTDIAIIGGGASGLTAALTAARAGAAVVVLEKLPRVGKKILATGNGRCNLGHLSQDPAHFHGSMDTQSTLDKFPGEAEFFRGLGLWVRPDEAGRLYPASGQAASVLDALRLCCGTLGVQEVCGVTVTKILPQAGGFLVRSADGGTVHARRVILAAGGAAGPQYGTSGDGCKLAQALGHPVSKLYPALGPVAVAPGRTRALKGLRVQAKVTALQDGKPVAEQEGQVQFADGALSGICVFNLATYRAEVLSLNLVPWCGDGAALVAEIARQRSGVALEDMLTGILSKRVGQVLMKSCTDRPLTAMVSALGPEELQTLANRLMDWQFPVLPGGSWEAAQVTAGGVTGVGPTLESSRVPGLYFAGEVLDVHGDSGGFNLRWAWASGMAAGEQAARGLKR